MSDNHGRGGGGWRPERSIRHGKLVGREVVPWPVNSTEDLLAWAEWFDDANNRRVFFTNIGRGWVSTIFLGINHGMPGIGVPGWERDQWFETGIRNPGGHIEVMERYATYDEAEAGHQRYVAEVTEQFHHRILFAIAAGLLVFVMQMYCIWGAV